jgi:hypothetical protein
MFKLPLDFSTIAYLANIFILRKTISQCFVVNQSKGGIIVSINSDPMMQIKYGQS